MSGTHIDESLANAEPKAMSGKTTLDAPQGASDDTRPTTAVATEEKGTEKDGVVKREVGGKFDFWFVPIPPRLRYDSEKPAHFGILLNAVFGFASTFSALVLIFHR